MWKKGNDMMKEYQKPEFELITLVAQENITNDDGVIGGQPGVESAFPGWG